MSFLKDIFRKKYDDSVRVISSTVDSLSTSDQEKLNVKHKLSEVVLTVLLSVQQMKAEIIEKESMGNGLQRSVRPIISLSFTAVILYALCLGKNMPPEFWSLAQLTVGGHFVTRGVQNIAQKVTNNLDLSFLRKKDRKDSYER